ncbi:MAG: 50S ribosomal protein L1 [Anaerolineae bacterium]|nr:MAG: 50S ribosomal protein L1 [Anaerolineae bacterium]
MPKRGRKYKEAAAKIDRERAYSPQEAIELVKEISFANFDETVELHLKLGVDPRHADQQVRGVVVLPHGLGKTVRILVFAEGDDERLAKEAGADLAGSDELIQQIQGGWLEFDVAIAVPSMMGKVGRLGRILGPRGLMPSPKAGTIAPADQLPALIKETRQGRVEFRVDRTANVHVPFGKLSFPIEKLLDNMTVVMEAIRRARPAATKGRYVHKITLTSCMGPGIKVDSIQAMAMEVA